jgi:hypothetical protein
MINVLHRIITDSGVVGPMFLGGAKGSIFPTNSTGKLNFFSPPPVDFFRKKITGRNVKIAFVALFLN